MIDLLKRFLERRKQRAKEVAMLDKYGWFGTCENCGGMLPEQAVKYWETLNHWHYQCECGREHHFSLIGPFPIYDPNLEYGYVKNLEPTNSKEGD